MHRRTFLTATAAGVLTAGVPAAGADPAAKKSPAPPPEDPSAESGPAEPSKGDGTARYETVTLRGKIVWQGEALKRKFDVTVDPDAEKTNICLETADGGLVPIVKDFRGRGFHLDPKLHAFDWELVARRFPGSPAVQVVRTYVRREGRREEFDYWCDICAIPMYELKECECCQGPIRFRFREAPADSP